MAKFKLLTDENLMYIVQHPAEYPNNIVVCAMELLQYRMHYGSLGVEYLHAGKFEKMVRVGDDAKPVPSSDDDPTG